MPKNPKTTILLPAAARQKIREWIRRYTMPEICGTITALLAAWLVYYDTQSLAAAAIAGSLAETIGYYGYAGWREAMRQYRYHHQHTRFRRYVLTAIKTIRDMLVEFGPGEIIDSLFARPFLMYLLPHLLGNFTIGILLGKLAADIIFYGFAALFYELKKKYLYAQKEEY